METQYEQKLLQDELHQLRTKVSKLEQSLALTESSLQIVSNDLQFHKSLINNLPNGFIFVFDKDLHYRMAEGSLLETPKELMIGKHLKDLVSAQNYDLIEYHYLLALQGQESSFELNWHEKTFLTRVRPLHNKDGNITGGLAMVQDITVQKQAEEKLRQSEARYRVVSEMTTDFVWVATGPVFEQFKIDWVTDAVETVTGYTMAEFAELGGVGGICVQEDLPNLQKMRQKLISKQTKRTEGECRIICKNKQIRWLHLTGFPLFKGGEVIGLIAAAQDITAQKQAQVKLRQSEARYRAVSEMTTDFVWAVAGPSLEQFKVEWVTDAVETVTGYTIAEFKERTDAVGIIVPEDLPLLMKSGQELSGGKCRMVELDCRILRKDKQIRWLHLVIRSIPDNAGKIQGFIVAAKDITQSKQIEVERQALDRQLQNVQKLETLGVFAAGLAHDFNNLLSVILNNLSMAQLELNPNTSDLEVVHSLQEAEKASYRAIGLTRQLLTFAKGGVPVRKTAQLNELIKESANLMISGSRAYLDLDIEPDLWAAEVDTSQISQVIQNLVLNAVQAMPNGGNIRLVARNANLLNGEVATLEGGRYVQIQIHDEGTGIAPENLAKIFDPFFTTKELGSGLGLAMVFSIIRHHGGYVQVESEPGDGTCFTVYLPASNSPQILTEQASSTSVSPQAVKLSPGRILIMDDEPSILQSMSRLLTLLGYSCEGAAEGQEALRLYKEAIKQQRPFTAAILDLTIRNGMGGEETVREILKIDPNAKVIVSSGYSEDLIMANYRRYGFSGIIKKPYSSKELQKVLADVLD